MVESNTEFTLADIGGEFDGMVDDNAIDEVTFAANFNEDIDGLLWAKNNNNNKKVQFLFNS